MKEDNLINLNPYIKQADSKTDKLPLRAKYQSNPLLKKYLVINVKNNTHKFTVADLFN